MYGVKLSEIRRGMDRPWLWLLATVATEQCWYALCAWKMKIKMKEIKKTCERTNIRRMDPANSTLHPPDKHRHVYNHEYTQTHTHSHGQGYNQKMAWNMINRVAASSVCMPKQRTKKKKKKKLYSGVLFFGMVAAHIRLWTKRWERFEGKSLNMNVYRLKWKNGPRFQSVVLTKYFTYKAMNRVFVANVTVFFYHCYYYYLSIESKTHFTIWGLFLSFTFLPRLHVIEFKNAVIVSGLSVRER